MRKRRDSHHGGSLTSPAAAGPDDVRLKGDATASHKRPPG